MSQHAFVRVHGELRDLVRADGWIEARFDAAPSVKDLVESAGVPHPEIGAVILDGGAAALTDRVTDGARIDVHPASEQPLDDPRFVCDVHLGRLARHLRLCGFDTRYRNDADDADLARIAATEHRVLLTRDVGLLKRSEVTAGRWVRATEPRAQLLEVLRRYRLAGRLAPFARCLECNGRLAPVAKADVTAGLPPHVRATQDDFVRCDGCDRVYWRGTHHERLAAIVAGVRAELGAPLP